MAYVVYRGVGRVIGVYMGVGRVGHVIGVYRGVGRVIGVYRVGITHLWHRCGLTSLAYRSNRIPCGTYGNSYDCILHLSQ